MWGEMDTTLMAMAADRRWVSDEWVARWRDQQERMGELMRGVVPPGGESIRWGDGPGALWIGLHPLHAAPRLFAACSAVAAEGRGTLSAVGMQRARKDAPGEWLTWWDARTRAKQLNKPAAGNIVVGAMVGGVYAGGGSTIAMAVEVRAGVDVVQVQQGPLISRARLGTRWFSFTGEARQLAARQLLDEQGVAAEWSSYMAMRSAVAGRARKLILAGQAPQDTTWPVNLGKGEK